MAQLNDSQVTMILNRIVADGVTNADLQNGLLDHYCCHIEKQMEAGYDFEQAYSRAFAAITPNGMHEIQEELFFLLTFKKQTTMKRIIYGSGFLAAFLISFAFLFIAMRYPGVPVLMIAGFSCLLVSIGTLFINAMSHANQHPRSYNSRMSVIFIAVLFMSTGAIFKTLHYPGANILFSLGACVLNFIFIPIFFYHLYTRSVQTAGAGTTQKAIYSSGFLAAFLVSTGILFRFMHWPGASVILAIGYGALIISSITILVNAINKGVVGLRLVAGSAAALLISIGTIFKLLQYPSANIQIVLGMLVLNFLFLPLFFTYLYKQALQKKSN